MTHPGGGSGGTGPGGGSGTGPGRTLERFSFGDLPLRVVTIGDEPWFVAADVARILGYRMASDMTRRLDPDDRGTRSMRTPSGQQEMTVISEPGLYVAILGSQVQGARDFKRWVTREVLPAIRKTGSYSAAQAPAIPQTYAEALRLAADEHERAEVAEKQLAIAAPKAHSWDVLASAHGDYDVTHAAQILSRDPAISTGQRRLFAFLADQGWIRRDSATGRWRAYQRAIDARWLSELPQHHYDRETGEMVLDPPQIRVTVKGLHRLHHLLGGTAAL
ncbi:MAG TPA: phage antirepressor KilAC domain-containing protein, partial [Micromonospora sp.]|nr:phage antirepressor KilAC domain-containing protein [Micromonospora sp.]